MRVEKTVFISYRRTNVYNALAIYQNLIHNGYDVFFDYASVKAGDFAQIILNQISARAHFVILLTPSALERCNEPDDWLRREIEHAIDLKRNIIPLMFEGFSFKDVEPYLTGKLALLKNYNAMRVPSDYFIAAMERLRNDYLSLALDAVIHPTPPAHQAQVAQIQAQAANQPEPTLKQLSAEDYYERAERKFREGDYRGVILDCDAALQLNPHYAFAYTRRSGARYSLGDIEGAYLDSNQAIELGSNDPRAYNNRGLVRSEQGNKDGAIADYTEAIRLNPQFALAYNNRGVARGDQGDMDGAIADYTEAIRLNPQDADAYNNRGNIYVHKGYIDRALADYTEAIRLSPEFAMAYNNRGTAHYNQSKWDAAIADYEAALQIDPNHKLAKGNLQLALDMKRRRK